MGFLFLIFIVFLVLEGFIIVEEETLILLASVFWVDAAGGMIKKALYENLHDKGDEIKASYSYFLTLQKKYINLLLELHEKRVKLSKVYSYLLGDFGLVVSLYNTLNSYFQAHTVGASLLLKEDLVLGGKVLVKNRFRDRVESILANSN